MRKRFFRKAVLAAVIAVPAVFSHPDSRALAQEEGKAIEREKEAAGAEEQEAWNSEEEMENISEDTGEEEDTGSEDATDLENQMDAEGDEGFFTENDLFSEMEEDDLLFSEGEEAVPEENMENLIDLYAAGGFACTKWKRRLCSGYQWGGGFQQQIYKAWLEFQFRSVSLESGWKQCACRAKDTGSGTGSVLSAP